MMSLRSTALGKIEGKESMARIYLNLQDNMSSLFSVYLLATAVSPTVCARNKIGLFCYFYVNIIDVSEVMLLVVVVDKSIIQRTICSILYYPSQSQCIVEQSSSSSIKST